MPCVSIVRSKDHRSRRKALRLYIGFSNSNPNLKTVNGYVSSVSSVPSVL
ncbi:MAG: hypothetical protein LBB88_12285 [Planctomycetaceae bacterium]|nr:hypothetical protein [Planctomycetaceae bacterium]